MKNFLKNKKGFSLLEMIFYIAIFLMLSMLIIESTIVLTKSFRNAKINIELSEGVNIMERIAREVRGASSIVSIASTDLKVRIEDGTVAGDSAQFTLSGANLLFYEDDVLVGNLNPSTISVSGLTFTQITTANSVAVKIEFTATSTRYGGTASATFYDTVVLRGSY